MLTFSSTIIKIPSQNNKSQLFSLEYIKYSFKQPCYYATEKFDCLLVFTYLALLVCLRITCEQHMKLIVDHKISK